MTRLRAIMFLLIISFSLLLVMLPGCQLVFRDQPPGGDARVAIVFDSSGLKDAFNYKSLAGAQRAERELGVKYDYIVVSGPDNYGIAITDFAKKGDYAIVFVIGSTLSDGLRKAASEYPAQKFGIIDGDIDGVPNIVSFKFRDDESSFLAGAVAGLVTKTGKIGFIGGIDLPVIRRFLSGYESGAKLVRPECQVLVDYAGSWSEPDKGESLALAQIGNGADVLFAAAGNTGTGAIRAAAKKNVYAIGVDTDQRALAPNNVLVSVLKEVDVGVYEGIRLAARDPGQFKGGIVSLGLKENGIGLSLDNALPAVTADIKKRVYELAAKISSGEIRIP